jgi:hypothetical protein
VKIDLWGACRRTQRACHDACVLLLPTDVLRGEELLGKGCCAALDQSYLSRGVGQAQSSLPDWYLHPSRFDLAEYCPGTK